MSLEDFLGAGLPERAGMLLDGPIFETCWPGNSARLMELRVCRRRVPSCLQLPMCEPGDPGDIEGKKGGELDDSRSRSRPRSHFGGTGSCA
jgi:hypothetical protein